MIINSFFKRNNTIIKNSTLNTAKNPVVELFYGGNSCSRYVFTIDYMAIFNNFLSGDFVIENIDSITHTLRMYNTSFFDYRLHTNKYLGKTRASSFDLVLYKLEDEFDEGNGYDGDSTQMTHGKRVLSSVPSNSLFRKNNTYWTETFAVDTSLIKQINYDSNGEYVIEFEKNNVDEETAEDVYSKIINIQHFETGKENIDMDITLHINAVISAMYSCYLDNDMDQVNFIAQNNNFCLAFTPQFENSKDFDETFVGFFSMYANSGYSPFVQSSLNDLINDDRTCFLANKLNRLYLYSKVGDEFQNLPNKPKVYIVKDPDSSLTDSKNLIIEFDESKVKNPMKGVYYIEFQMDDDTVEECDMLYDIWDASFNDGDFFNGYEGSIKQIEQSFNLIDSGYNSIGAFRESENTQVTLFHKGIDRDERINRGERRKVFITPKIKYTSNQIDEKSRIRYRVYSKEGINEIPFFEYSNLHRVNGGDRFFYLDTNSLLPNTYYVDIEIKRDGNVLIEKEFFSFRIISSPVFSKQNKNKNYRPKIKIKEDCEDGEFVIDLTDEGKEPELLPMEIIDLTIPDPKIGLGGRIIYDQTKTNE